MGRKAKRELDNIEKDSKMALELGYGVHYGNYKADYPNTAEPEQVYEEYHRYPERVCEYCGSAFWPNRPDQKYCQEECRHKANKLNAVKRPEMNRQLFCDYCGREITQRHKRKYCCGECARAANAQKQIIRSERQRRRKQLEREKALAE